jgi:hypothetical protein
MWRSEPVTSRESTSPSPAWGGVPHRCSSRAFSSGALAGGRQAAVPAGGPLGWGMPTQARYGLGQTMPPAELAAVVRYVGGHRDDGAGWRWKAAPTGRRLTAAGGT